ncbi:VOC family protein [Actinoplanes sp. LDG1-06]|uniref:VOC family protein n=1 Tax=Paractinoplanes ovalisporus TaxID=2810368 RepID=A0ABS2ARG7_9ACTN|nr:VOC family protein [Actinoplanes ovalisporus]MBM2622375.1 VOC family protein [Actinoplanes ovalisporus]
MTQETYVWPTLRANDARALIRFLADAFGFEEVVSYGDADRVDHAQLAWPLGGGIMLGSAGERGPDDAWALKPGTFGCYVVADDIDGLHDRALKAGADIVKAPYDTDYGSRDFIARNPEGNLWSFGTYRGEARS